MKDKKMNNEVDMNTEGNTNGDESTKSYEVGYGKPPKRTQFKKGTSGNPSGRPKRPLDFDAALLREARSFITISENGKKTRLSKHEVATKQLMNNAMKGKSADLRMYREAYRDAFEKFAEQEAEKAKEPHDDDINVAELPLDELIKLANKLWKKNEE